jgi:hypothetical protein
MVAMAVLLGVNRWRAGEIAPWHLASADTEAKPERETP